MYNQDWAYPPETMLSRDFFETNTAEFYRFYRTKMIVRALPNRAHFALAKLETKNKLKAIITQNIDGLHQAAGSKNVLELHGSIHRNYCMNCRKFYNLDIIAQSNDVPKCDCGGTIKPDVVLYGEDLDDNILTQSVEEIANCDTLIVGGTSLAVYPAAGLLDYFRGEQLVLINKSLTPYDNFADYIFRGKIGDVLGE